MWKRSMQSIVKSGIQRYDSNYRRQCAAQERYI